MKIVFKKSFEKQYKKLQQTEQLKVEEAIRLFFKNPLDPLLRNHALKGKLQGKRAIWVTGDMRIIFQEYDSYAMVECLAVGSHNQVY